MRLVCRFFLWEQNRVGPYKRLQRTQNIIFLQEITMQTIRARCHQECFRRLRHQGQQTGHRQ